MDSIIPGAEREEFKSVRSSTDIPSHGTIPKWLEDISQKVVGEHEERPLDVSHYFGVEEKIPTPNSRNSARYGRRSSQLLSNTPPKIDLEQSTYFVPKFEGKVDLKGFVLDPQQIDLEKSWKSLDNFKQSHKGRLDSAKNNPSTFIESYSSNRHQAVPKRSASELGYHEQPSGQRAYQAGFERKLNAYRERIEKENRLRDEIISELLSENENITEKLRKTHLEDDFPLVESKSRRRYHSNSKFKYKNPKKNENVFIIPELPSGKTLIIDILTTWGDKYYVGLNGVEIFGVDGKIVQVDKITAVPPDVNVLPGCHNDPRIVSNLLDGVNRTQDDMHIWLAPFEMDCSHIITMELTEVATLSMIRIWNYNKSRIHSYRGVRDVVIFLDDEPIFKGEIAKACGGILGGVDAFGDTILFTTDDHILENISKNDSSYPSLTSEPSTPLTEHRPPTATLTDLAVRPITGPVTAPSPIASPSDQILLGANEIEIILLSNWGHPTMIGLTGLEIVQGSDSVINLDQCRISTNVGNSFLKRLINGENITDKSEDMWWVRYQFEEEISLIVTFDKFRYLSGLKVWNYNGSLETSYAGVRALKIVIDGKPVDNPLTRNEIFILRRAPGNCYYDYVQDLKLIDLNEDQVETPPSLLDRNEFYEPSSMPEGFVVQIVIFSSWDDQYYCGLNGIEIYNQRGRKISLEEQNICAYPESVNSLPGVSGDVRTPEKLIDGVNNDRNGSHSWLAPIIPKHLNRIYIVMDQPIVVSLVKIWNYSKNPNRGVKEFGILVDDLLVYNGTLEKYSSDVHGGYQSVLFTENESIFGAESETVIRNSALSQDVVLLDKDLRATTGGSLPEADPALRPFTSVSPFNRGYTSYSH